MSVENVQLVYVSYVHSCLFAITAEEPCQQHTSPRKVTTFSSGTIAALG